MKGKPRMKGILLANRKTKGNTNGKIVHLVYADTQANAEKLKEPFFQNKN